MRRRLLRCFFVVAASLCPLWTGCAEQADDQALRSGDTNGASAGTSGSGGEGASTAGTGAAGKAATGGGGSGGSASSPAAGTGGAAAGTAPVAGSAPIAGVGGEGGGAGGEGGGGPVAECNVGIDCDDANPCTTDTCLLQHCSYTSNTTACADDQDPCTADVCAVGVCTHPDNKTCACKTDPQCDDKNVCTEDKCAANQCTHTSNTAACGVGTPFTVDSFNSDADWTAAKTTPDQRAIVVAGVNATNLEGNVDLWIAEADTGSIEFALASLEGLGKLRIVIRSTAANTAGMLFVGLWNGAAWSDKALSAYGAIPTSNYATLEVPTADFGQQLKDVSKLRLRFAVTGGEKTWQIDEISAAK